MLPSIAYPISSVISLTVAAIFGYLAVISRVETHYRFWTAAFICQAVRQGFNLLAAQGSAAGVTAAEAMFVVTLALTAVGTLAMIDRLGEWRRVAAVAAVALAWLGGGAILRFDGSWQVAPVYLLVGGVLVWTGIAMLQRDRHDPGVGLKVLAILFMMWGAHIAAASHLRGVAWIATPSFLLNLVLNCGIVLFLLITAQRRTELLRRRSEAQLRTLADSLPLMIAHVDTERRIRFINRTNERWYARPAAEIIGRRLDELLPRNHVEANQASSDLALAGRTVHFERTLPYPDGVTRTVEVFYIPERGEDDTVRGVFAVVSDISERRATEEQLRQSQKMEAVGQLTGGVAHDFNNLLAVVSGNLELLEEGLEDRPKLRDVLQRAARAVDRGAMLTRSLLAFARRQPLQPRVVDLTRAVSDMADLLRRTVPEAIGIQLSTATGLWLCTADLAQVQNALLNLVLNARDAMPNGGRLTIETANVHLDDAYAAANAEVTAGDYVMLAVSDTGTGMPPEVVARAFDPFYTTKRGGSGTGLGLSMVYGFAKQSDGHAKIYSEPGHGTTVKLYLPRSDAAEEPAAAAGGEAQEINGNGALVLVVEDDDDVRRLSCDLLAALGYRPVAASQGAQALTMLRAQPEIELMLTDVMLPGAMNGRVLAEIVQRERPRLRVLYMSGYTENAVIHHGRLDAGVILLQKPFRRRDLAQKLRQLTARPVEAR
jgi:PAS domain S-box-containing protein